MERAVEILEEQVNDLFNEKNGPDTSPALPRDMSTRSSVLKSRLRSVKSLNR